MQLPNILSVLRNIWKKRRIPEDWRKDLIIPIYKRGDTNNAKITEVTLLSQSLNTDERIINLKLRRQVENKVTEEQYGFRDNRSTVDVIFTLRQMLDKRWVFGQ